MANPLRRELMARTRNASDWLDIRNEGDSTMIRLHGVIGDWWDENTSAEVAAKIDAITADRITVSVNSVGGDIFDGVAIYNALRAHPAKVTMRVDGLAASIASVIVQAGDERQMMGGSQMMIHNAWTIAAGDAADMRKAAEVLDRQNVVIAEIYADHSDTDAAAWLDLMATETWYTASGAVEAGLADAVVDGSTQDPAPGGAAQARFDPALTLALLDL